MAVAYFGVYSFIQLDFAAYLFDRVQFAFADFSAPIDLLLMNYASIAVLICGLFHSQRAALEPSKKN